MMMGNDEEADHAQLQAKAARLDGAMRDHPLMGLQMADCPDLSEAQSLEQF